MKVRIKRWYRNLATYGDLDVINDAGSVVFSCKTLELPWRENKRSISCIPEGEYEVIEMPPTPKRPYHYFWVQNVPGRTGILFHPGTYTSHIKGCILPGDRLTDLDVDGVLDVVNTAKTLKRLTDLLPGKFRLTITNAEL